MQDMQMLWTWFLGITRPLTFALGSLFILFFLGMAYNFFQGRRQGNGVVTSMMFMSIGGLCGLILLLYALWLNVLPQTFILWLLAIEIYNIIVTGVFIKHLWVNNDEEA